MKTEVVAEIGINHEGDRESAAQLAREAQLAGASAVKLQLFDANKLCAIRGTYTAQGLLQATQLTVQDLEYVRDRLGIPVYASVFNTELLDRYAAAGFTRIKIACREFEHQPELVQAIGADTRFTRVETSVPPGLLANEGLTGRLVSLGSPARSVFALLCIAKYPVNNLEDWEIGYLDTLRWNLVANKYGLSAHFPSDGAGMSFVVASSIALGVDLFEVHFRGSMRAEHAREGMWSLSDTGLKRLLSSIIMSERVINGRTE